MDPRASRIVVDALAAGGNLVVLTGAGISAESGVPTFRGPEGFWTIGSRDYHPQELATAAAFSRMPREIWSWYLFRRGVCRGATPNAGHQALAAIEHALPGRFTLVTQNVDGLHLRAGNSAEHTLQIHGNIDFLRCADACSTRLFAVPHAFDRFGRGDVLDDEAFAQLRCPQCGAPARPHVLWFDECYDEPLFRAESAMHRARAADVLVVVGTAGATNLPLQIGHAVAADGRPIIDINTQDNPFAALAQRSGGCALRGTAADILPALRDAVQAAAG